MKTILRALAIASLVLSLPLSAADNAALSEGTIKKIDPSGQRVTLAHGQIANINMPPMTMSFKVKEAALLKVVKEGDKVRFRVEDIGGDYTVVRIEPAK